MSTINDFVIKDGILLSYKGDDTHVVIPEGVTEIARNNPYYGGAFLNNEKITSVTLPEGLQKIGETSFSGCSNLKFINFPKSLEVIGPYAFGGCKALEEICLFQGLKQIGKGAFSSCSSARKIVIPDSVAEIGGYAFASCLQVKELMLPDSIQNIGEGAFRGCTGLVDENGFFILGNTLCCCNSSAENLTIPERVQIIGACAFEKMSHIQTLIVPKDITRIEANAFSGCTGLKQIVLPDSVRFLGERAFEGCKALESIELSANLETIGSCAFAGCASLQTISLPEKLATIGGSVFYGCHENLRHVRIPSNISKPMPTEVANEEMLVIPEFVFGRENEIPGSVYYNNPYEKGDAKLFTIAEGETVTSKLLINGDFKTLFDKKGNFDWIRYDMLLAENGPKIKLGVIFRPLAMAYRLRYPHKLRESLKKTYEEHVCKNIKRIAPYVNILPEDGLIALLESIGAIHDKNRKNLLPLMGLAPAPVPKEKKDKKSAKEKTPADSVKTPAQIKKEWNIKKQADGTLRLSSYKGKDTVVNVPAVIGEDLVTVIGNECFCCGGWGSTSEQQLEIRKKIVSVIIPEGITEIGEYAFAMCESLESVTLPMSLKSISERAFMSCRNLKQICVPEGVVLGENVFTYCKGLADEQGLVVQGNVLFGCYCGGDVVVPDHVKRIESNAFSGIKDLKSIVFPDGLVSLPGNLISKCEALEQITIPASVIDINSNVFPDRNKLQIYGYGGSQAEKLCQNSWGRLTFISLGTMEVKETEFVITDGVLTRYMGKEKEVTIPARVKVIGSYSSGWYDHGAFEDNKTVESIILPEGMETISERAFAECRNLRKIHIPETVIQADKSAFYNTPWLDMQKEGAVYAGRALILLNPPQNENASLKELIVREGTKSIGKQACYAAKSLKKLVLPEGLERIGEDAFSFCDNLEEIVAPASLREIGKDAFLYCHNLKHCSGDALKKTTKLSAKFKVLYTADPEDTAWVVLYQQDQSWRNIVREKLNESPGTVGQVMKEMARLINAMDVLDKSVGNRAATFAQEHCRGADCESLAGLYQALKNKSHPAIKKLDADEKFRTCMERDKQEDLASLHPVEVLVVQNLQHTPGFDSLLDRIVECVPYAGTEEMCSNRVLAYVAYEYIRQYDPESVKYVSMYQTACTAYQFSSVADEVAAALDAQKLQEALLRLAEQYGGAYWIPYARYADDKHTVSLLSQMREWDSWNKYGAIGRKLIINARSGMLLNDTKAAMIHMDQVGCLEKYAAIRNTDADTIRDTILSDFGFDENREIRYELGGNVVSIRIDDDLKLTIFDTNSGKIVKTIPKKNADPELYEKAKTALSELKKNIKKVITNRKKALFADFLSGAQKEADKWKQSYLGNPVLNSVARLVVWSQEGTSFTLSKDGAIDSGGSAYTITDAPICVSHPIELRSEISAWQNYFTDNGLKQPFEQIWEPAYEADQIRPDRYIGSSLNVYRLANKEQHGITVWGLRDYSEDYGFELKDCKMEQDTSEWRFIHGITDDATFALGKFTFENYTRQVNHLVYLFDKWTVADRIAKDDVTVVDALQSFTAAQIKEFIELANQKGSTNCTALLLNYQNQKFGTFDPLVEFTLDL